MSFIRIIVLLLLLVLSGTPLFAGQNDPASKSFTLYPEGTDSNLQHEFDWYGDSLLLAGLAQGDIPETESTLTGSEVENFDLEQEFAESSAKKVFDPLSGYNRFMTQVNDRLYFWVLKPVARGYGAMLPQGARRGVSRFFGNLLTPVRLVNNLLQLKIRRAGIELARFTLNTTVGVLGFGDPAQKWYNLQPCPEDFGQTLGHYGVGGGFHLVLPVLGPSNLRDAIGKVPDYLLNPVSYLDEWEAELAVKSYDRINHTSLHIGEYESVKKDAIDLYTFIRDAYEQSRNEKIEE